MMVQSDKPLHDQQHTILQNLDDLTNFNTGKVNIMPHPDAAPSANGINGAVNIFQFKNQIDLKLNSLKKFLDETLKIQNTSKRLEYLEEVKDKINGLQFDTSKAKVHIIDAKKDLSKKIDKDDWEYEGEMNDYIFSDWQQFLGEAATEYTKIPARLNNIIQSFMEKAGFELNPDGKIIAVDSQSLPLRWFSSKLNGKQLAYFIQLCIDTQIIKPIANDKKFNSSRKDVARMIAENFQTQQGRHFSARSFYEDMKKPPGDFSKSEVKQILRDMINRI